MTNVAKRMTSEEFVAGVASQYAAGGAKTANSIVKNALEAYAKTAVKLHVAACVTLFHAAQTGDTRPLTNFFDGIRQNDRDALRLWVGKHAKVTLIEDETETEKSWISFSKDKGFTIIKNTENVRVGYFDLVRLLNGVSFQDMDQAKEAKEVTLATILAMLARVQKQTEKKAEEGGIALPKVLRDELSKLTATVASIDMAPAKGATLNA